ncbi:hypothetical protein [Salinivibrio socompensis]|uniref:hypothetical protein n=1 Tax=Salinivibrio socompensis TaxID=1510206 RepID=UPI00046F80C3|nr:hypothetical protein [Salinivibrio socompensis]
MADIAKLTVALYANSAQFVSEMDRSKRYSKNWSDKIGKLSKAAGAAMAASMAASALAITAVYKEQAALIDQTAKFADRIGITTKALTELHYASELTGVGQQKLNMSLQRMTRRVQEAAKGTGEAKNAIRELGLDAVRLGKMTPDQQLYTLADAFANVKSQSDRVRLAFKLFDSEGVAIVNMLSNGADGLRNMAEEADQLGISLSRIDAAKVEMANDALFKVSELQRGIKMELTTQLAPVVATMADQFTNYAKQQGGLNVVIAASIRSTLIGFAKIGDFIRRLNLGFKTLQLSYQAFVVAFKVGVQGIVNVLHDMGDAILEFVTKPILASLDALAPMSDTAKEVAAEIRAINAQGPLQLFDKNTLAQDKQAFFQTAFEISEIMNTPPPSDAVDAWFSNVQARYEELGRVYADSINYNTPAANDGDSAANAKPMRAVQRQREETERIATEYARRLILQQNANQRAKLEEDFAYQDRLKSLSDNFKAAYSEAAGNQALQNQLEREQFTARELIWKDHQARLTEIEKASSKQRYAAQAAQMRNYSNLFGDISDIAKEFAGEQSGIYKAMFAASKAFAIAESIIKIQQGIASAASLPFPSNIPAIGQVVAATSGIVSTIQGTQLKGMAHDGIDSVPREGTWLLDKGERVYKNDSAQRIDAMYGAVMNMTRGGQSAGGQVVVHQQNHYHLDGRQNDDALLGQISQITRQTTLEVIQNQLRPGGMLAAS